MREKLVEKAREIECLTDRPRFLRAMSGFDNQLQDLLMQYGLRMPKVEPPEALKRFHPSRKMWLRRCAEEVARHEQPTRMQVICLMRRFIIVMCQYRVSSAELERMRMRINSAA